MLSDWESPPEKYSSYRKRMFNRYHEKARKLFNGIDDTSLTRADKNKLKKEINNQLSNQNTINILKK